jgi:hypothetical protein
MTRRVVLIRVASGAKSRLLRVKPGRQITGDRGDTFG